VEVLNRGNRRNPDVLLVEAGGRRVVVKDFAPRSAWVRATLGRWITAREVGAYRRLAGLSAVPRFLGRIDALAFAVEYRPGRRISRHLARDARPEFVDLLEAAVRAIHGRGVVHLDLGHRSNVLVDASGRPVLIDFASAVWMRPGGWAHRRVLPWLARWDLRAVEKFRAKMARLRPAVDADQPSPDAAPAAGPEADAPGPDAGSRSGRAASRPT
jgi:RIO-like serine/threonine protein kinase